MGKTAHEKAKEFLLRSNPLCTVNEVMELEMLLKEQDRDTRHACAQKIMDLGAAHSGDDDLIERGVAHAACMNARSI